MWNERAGSGAHRGNQDIQPPRLGHWTGPADFGWGACEELNRLRRNDEFVLPSFIHLLPHEKQAGAIDKGTKEEQSTNPGKHSGPGAFCVWIILGKSRGSPALDPVLLRPAGRAGDDP
jgi:hypothetical protein